MANWKTVQELDAVLPLAPLIGKAQLRDVWRMRASATLRRAHPEV